MIRILFVCHGNICRSPMAEFIMKDIVRRNGCESGFYIASAATSTEEIGNPVYPPAKAELAKHGLGCKGKTAVQITHSDYNAYDLIIVMDSGNMINITRIIRSDPENKIHKLSDFSDKIADVSDPWYTRRFDVAYNDIYEGCSGLFEYLMNEYGK